MSCDGVDTHGGFHCAYLISSYQGKGLMRFNAHTHPPTDLVGIFNIRDEWVAEKN